MTLMVISHFEVWVWIGDHIRRWCYASVGALYIKQNCFIRKCIYWKNAWIAVFAGGTNSTSKRSFLSICQPSKNEYSLCLRIRNSVTGFSRCYIKNCGSYQYNQYSTLHLSLFYLLFNRRSRPHYLTIWGQISSGNLIVQIPFPVFFLWALLIVADLHDYMYYPKRENLSRKNNLFWN